MNEASELAPIRGRRTAALASQPRWLRIGGGIIFTLAAFSISIAMQLPQQGYTFLLLYPAVIASAYFAGRDSGLAATATGALCVGGLMLVMWDSANHMLLVQIASLVLFIVIGSGSAVLLSRLKRALRQLEASNARLIEATDSARLASEETDLLLRELRHRIRNDLSNIIAIIRMQAKSMPPDAAAHLTGSADRLQVLAKVHERLSRQGHSPVVDMKPFLEDLCNELRSTLLPLKPVALETDIDAVSLPSARAVSVGLILNELVTNAIKYA
ncbi:MAG TPA: sensor histidine kinase, partial [Sphingomicrobium sp.]|nr:sensor histidine kinase [Sphingomicrobium sp.]